MASSSWVSTMVHVVARHRTGEGQEELPTEGENRLRSVPRHAVFVACSRLLSLQRREGLAREQVPLRERLAGTPGGPAGRERLAPARPHGLAFGP